MVVPSTVKKPEHVPLALQQENLKQQKSKCDHYYKIHFEH
jgi:hypothetical protein